MPRIKFLEHFDRKSISYMLCLWQDFLIKVAFEGTLVRSVICFECLTYVPPLAKYLLIPSPPHLAKFPLSRDTLTKFLSPH